MCVTDLKQQAAELVRNGIRGTTKSTYSTAQKRFLKFCDDYELSPIPCSHQTILLYVTYLHNAGLTANSVSVYISAVRSLHVLAGLPEPELRTPQVKLALKAMVAKNPPLRKKLPITYDMLKNMLSLLAKFPDRLMWSALLTLAFFAGLRGVEYVGQSDQTATTVGQLQFGPDPINIMYFTLLTSKTTTHGFTIPLGCSRSPVCALCAMIGYLNNRYKQQSYDSGSKLFVFHNGTWVNKSHVNALIKMLVKAMGLDPSHYSAHSIRAGAATTAAHCGFSDWEIMRVGGWKSRTYRDYIRNLDSHVAGFSARMAGNQS